MRIFLIALPVFCLSQQPQNTGPPLPRHGIDFLGPLWLPRTFKTTCCRGGNPVADNPKWITNWTQTVSDYAVDESAPQGQDDHCRVFEGSFLLSATALFNYSFSSYGVQCKCPESSMPLDRHCRQLPPCRNNGYRSLSMAGQCACTEPYFGELCEKTCDQGQILKSADGRAYCSCLPFYQGEQCTDMVCLNGGVEAHGRCSCPPSYLGYHCEVDSNRSSHAGTRFQRFGENNEVFSRDISGTVFSLVMIVVLVVSMYLLMKHRMQVQSRFASTRRDEMSRTAAIYGLPPAQAHEARIAPFLAVGIEGPPPYAARETRGRQRNEILPPLPTYEDATKDVPLRTWAQAETTNEPSSSAEAEQPPSSQHPQSSETTAQGPAAPTIDRKVITRRSL